MISCLFQTCSKIGFACRAYILLGVAHSDKDALLKHLEIRQNVNSLFRINNGWTVILEGVFRDMFALEEFIEDIETKFTLKRKEVCYVLDEVKRERFLSDPHFADDVADR